MTYANEPMAAESKALEHADFSETQRDTGEDQAAHAAGEVCARCGREIQPAQDARLRGESGWVHDVCPLSSS